MCVYCKKTLSLQPLQVKKNFQLNKCYFCRNYIGRKECCVHVILVLQVGKHKACKLPTASFAMRLGIIMEHSDYQCSYSVPNRIIVRID